MASEASEKTAGLSSWQLKTVLTVLLTGQLLSALDQTIVGTALPRMVGEFGQLDSFSLVVTSYLLTTTVATALYGKLGDLYGAKNLYMIAIGVFTASSLAVGLAQDMTQLVIFRALQGLGAGGLVVMAFTISATVVPPRQLGRIQGLVGAMYALASLLGPLAGGALTEYVSWRWCFLINVPIGIAALLALGTLLKLPANRREHKVDYVGATLLVAAVSALVLVTIWGGTTFEWSSTPILGLLAAVIVLVVLLVIWERKAAEPIISPALLRKPEISLAMIITFIVGVATIGAYFFLPIYLQVVRGDDPMVAGLNLLPLMIAVMLGSGASGWLISAVLGRMKVVVVAGVGVMTVGLYLFSLLDASTPVWQLWAYQAVLGIGMGMVISKLIVSVQNVVSRRDIGTITAQASFFRVIGSAIGTAAFGALLVGGGVYGDPTAIKDQAAVAGFADSLQTVFLVAVAPMVVAFVLSLFLPNTKLADTGHGHGAPGGPGGGPDKGGQAQRPATDAEARVPAGS